MSEAGDSGFLSRWSRRKVQARQGGAPEERASRDAADVPQAPVRLDAPAVPATLAPQSVDAAAPVETAAAKPAAPTMDDVAMLTRESDFSRFVSPGVDGDVKNAALKKLFADPHFNAMDGLDIYIDDYTKPDPLPLSSLRKMAQAAFLGLVEAEPPAADAKPLVATDAIEATDRDHTAQALQSAEVEADATTPEPDEDADLRLQSHDAAGRGGAEDGAAADERRQP